MARIASIVLVVVLLAATAAAFALTQGLKLKKSPIFGTAVERVFSPVCECDRQTATIAFRLRERDTIDIAIVDGDDPVRTIVSGSSRERGRVFVEWDGRDDAGRVLPEGEYRPRVRLRRAHQTITLPNPIRIDVTPPVIQDVSARPSVISPDGDGRADRVVVTYRLSEDATGRLFVNGRRYERKLFARTADRFVWNGRLDGSVARPGTYALSLGAVDRAGNRADRTSPVLVQLRYVTLGRDRITVAAGARFALRVSADAQRVRWTLGGRSGFARPGTLQLRAPLQKGHFTLTVTANGRASRAAVFVREPAS